ncbi:MAG: amidohydrolase family protein [Cyanobium sp.]
MNHLPPLAIPRCLIDPTLPLPQADGDGFVRVCLSHREGQLIRLEPHGGPEPAQGIPLALTPLVEAHAHLDKAFSAPLHANRAGSIGEALRVNTQEAHQRTPDLVAARAERALEQAWRYGLRAIRSHLDSSGAWGEFGWEVLGQARERWAGRVELELVALVPIEHWLSREGEQLARRVAAKGGLLGGVLGPPFSQTGREREGLLALLALAEREGCGIDLHIDESDQPPPRGLNLLREVLLEHRFGGVPLVASHASSMGLMDDRALRRLAEGMAEARVGVVALPTTNLWLLNRDPERTPARRPKAPIRQLQQAGVTVAVGGDNVQDPWFPGGDFDPIELIRQGTLATHLLPWERAGLAPFTTAPAQLMGLPWDGVLRIGGPADLVVLAATSWTDLLARSPQRRVLRQGVWLDPPQAESPSPLLGAFSAEGAIPQGN